MITLVPESTQADRHALAKELRAAGRVLDVGKPLCRHGAGGKSPCGRAADFKVRWRRGAVHYLCEEHLNAQHVTCTTDPDCELLVLLSSKMGT